MKKFFSILSILFFLGANTGFAQQTLPFPLDSASSISNTPVAVEFIANTWVLVPTEVNNRRYLPINLDAQYQKKGLTLIVSGVVGKIPPNVRMVGTPFKITAVAVQKKKVKKPGDPIKLHPSDKPKKDKFQARPDRSKKADAPIKATDGRNKKAMIWDMQNKKGRIKYNKTEGGFYSIKIEGKNYVVENLPKDFQKNGLRVILSGKADNGRSNTFTFGPILTIDSIKKYSYDKTEKMKRKVRGNR